jgi:6-pyruvoyltetrahydropterin/6-carboxytetrahydropterin synthase
VFEIVVEGFFSAAHAIRLYDGSIEPRHGHDWKVAVEIRSETLDSIGVVADFEQVKPALKAVLSEFEGKDVGKLAAFEKLNPSTENIARVIGEKLASRVKLGPARIAKVTVWETPDASASYLP